MSNLSKLSIVLYLAIVGCYFMAALNSGHISHLIYSKGVNLSLVESNEMDSSVTVSDYIEKDFQGREFITPENMEKIQDLQQNKRESIIRSINETAGKNERVSISNNFIALMFILLVFFTFFGGESINGYKGKTILVSILLLVNLFVVQYSIINFVFIAALLMLFVKEFGHWSFSR